MTRPASVLLVALALLAGCSAVPPQAPGNPAFVAPNPQLKAQGIPPIPRELADDFARYSNFRGHEFVAWHPTRREMLVVHRKVGGNTAQIFRLVSPLGEPEQLTDFADPVRNASYEPLAGDSIVFERSSGGDEAAQLYRLDLASRAITQVSEPDMRHSMEKWLHRSSRLLYLSLPLDRTATAGRRTEITQSLTLVDPARPEGRRKLADLPGGGWSVSAVSWNDQRLLLNRYRSAAESELWLLDTGSGARRRLLPAPDSAEKANFSAAAWKKDDSGVFFLSDRAGEFRELMFLSLADGGIVPMTHHVKGDVQQVSTSADGRVLAVTAKVQGRTDLLLFDAEALNELPSPALPEGSVTEVGFHPTLPVLAYGLDSSKGPGQVGTLLPADGSSQAWTRPYSPPGIDSSRFGGQQIVHWKSFDGREITGIANLPPARFAGPRPVLIEIHGGPEGDATFGFLGRANYYLEELGIAVIQPNVRGSDGFGKTFLALDDGMKREDAVKDIGALLDWIATQPRLDPKRVLVSGGSYGGYMSLAVATHYADRIAGAIDIVGISSFLTFLENTESYRRDLRRVEYGDERDPAMREFLERISPLHNAAKITKPLFVVQGRNDPRVPWTEAEQIVARARANGTNVWYLLAENEGHGFVRKENADFLSMAVILFMRETLLK